MTSSPDTLAPGGIVADRYQIVAALGADGSGSVFHATDTRAARDVTLRLFAASAWDGEERALFGDEVRAAAGVEHPNVERVLELGTDPALGADFVVEERPRGETLATLLAQRGAPPRPLALRVLLEAAAGIAAGHRAGIVHGDLHPGNVFLARMEEEKRLRVRVVGLGMRRGRAVPLTGMPVAPRYAAPERLRRAGLSPASDVFSLGVMAYELLAGLPAQWNALLAAMARGQPAPIPSPRDTRPDLSPALAEVVVRALEADPRARFTDGAAFAAALARAAEMSAPSPAAAAPVVSPPEPAPSSSAPAPAEPPVVQAAPSVQAEPVAPVASVPAAVVPSPVGAREEIPPASRPSPPAPPVVEAPRPSRAKAPAVVATDLRDALYIPPEEDPPRPAFVPAPAPPSPPAAEALPAAPAPAAIASPAAAPARDPWSISSEARGGNDPVSPEPVAAAAPVPAAPPAAPLDADREVLPVAVAPAREETPVPSPAPSPAPAVEPRRPRFGAQPQKPARSGRGMLVGGGLAAAAVVGLLVWKVGFGVGGPLSADAAVSVPSSPRPAPAGASSATPATPVQAPAAREEAPTAATPPAAPQKVAETVVPNPREQARAAEEERRRREAAELARRQEAQRQALAQAQQPAAVPPPQAPAPTPPPEPERTAQVAAAAPAAAPVRGPAAAPVSRYSPTRVYNAGEVDAAASLSNRAEVASALSRNPPAALNLGSTVSARVRFVVLESGRVDPASITVLDQTHDGVEDPARRVLARARYEPARVEGKAVKSYVTMPVTWRPPQRE
jgi:TonB family protein